MRIHRVHIRNFLSFDEFEWRSDEPGLHVLVGPNGAGKTNLFRAIRAVQSAIHSSPRPRHSGGDRRISPPRRDH